jgi:hypothetical protein
LTRDEARGWYVQILLEKVRNDAFPSATHMALIEDSIPREMVPDYLEVLMDKVTQDTVPSIPMLHRIQRVAESLPRFEQQSS